MVKQRVYPALRAGRAVVGAALYVTPVDGGLWVDSYLALVKLQ